MIVVDASVLIAHLDERDAHHDRAVELLLDHAEHALGASPISVADVLVGPARQDRLEAARAALDELGLTEIPSPDDASVRLAGLRAETQLRLPDCCVLLAATDVGAHALLTFDDRLRSAASRLGVMGG